MHLGEEKGDGSAYDGAYLPRERLDHAMYSLGAPVEPRSSRSRRRVPLSPWTLSPPPPGIAWAASESLDQDVQVSARRQELDESRRISHQTSRISRSQVVEEALGTKKGPGTKLEERIDAICTELGLPEGADEV